MTDKNKQKKTKNKFFGNARFILGFLLVLLVIAGVFVFIFKILDNPTRYDYAAEDGTFHITKGKISGVDIFSISVFADNIEYIHHFRHHPGELEDIYLEPGIKNLLNRPNGLKNLYITRPYYVDEKDAVNFVLAMSSFGQILGTSQAGIYKTPIVAAYTVETEEEYVIDDQGTKQFVPKAGCSYVDDETAVILLVITESTRVIPQYGKCIIIEGKNMDDLLKAAEKFGYHLLGVF